MNLRCGRHPKLAAIVLCVLTLCAAAQAAPELAPGLLYLRPSAQLESTPIPVETPAVVIDLRQITLADTDAANALLASIKPAGTTSHRLILALVEPETAPALRTRLAQLPRCLTIGRTAPDFKTDLGVNTTAEAAQLALAALASGTPPEKLLADRLEKTRYDESALMREHSGEPRMAMKKAPSKQLGNKVTPLEPAAATDAVLLHAVHIYLGLVALKKL
jgi:hypothetical protein